MTHNEASEEAIHNAKGALQAALWYYDFDVDAEPKGSAVQCVAQAISAAHAAGAAEQRAKDAEIVRRLRDAARSVLCTEEAECLDEAAEIIELG